MRPGVSVVSAGGSSVTTIDGTGQPCTQGWEKRSGLTPSSSHPRVTNECPTNALPLHRSDLPALRRLGLALAPQGVKRFGTHRIDYRDAHAKAGFPTFYAGFVRTACPKAVSRRVIARTAVEAARERTCEAAVGAPAVGGRAAEPEQGESEVELGADSDHRVVIS